MIGFPVDVSHLGNSLDECSGLSWVLCAHQPDKAETAIDMIQGAVSDGNDHSLNLIFDARLSQFGAWSETAKFMRVFGTCNSRKFGSLNAALIRPRFAQVLKCFWPPPSRHSALQTKELAIMF